MAGIREERDPFPLDPGPWLIPLLKRDQGRPRRDDGPLHVVMLVQTSIQGDEYLRSQILNFRQMTVSASFCRNYRNPGESKPFPTWILAFARMNAQSPFNPPGQASPG